jgi:hypothetical protein
MNPFGLLYQPRMVDDDECGPVSGMIRKGNRSTLRKPAPVPLCPPQIPYAVTRALTLAASVGSQRLTARAMTGHTTGLLDPLGAYIHLH